MRNVRLRGKNKLADKWESDVYVVVWRAGDLPVYKVRPESGEGPFRTLHRDLLLPCRFLPVTESKKQTPLRTVRRPMTRQHLIDEGADTEEDDFSESVDISLPMSMDMEPIKFTNIHEPCKLSVSSCVTTEENQNGSDEIPSTSHSPVEQTLAGVVASDSGVAPGEGEVGQCADLGDHSAQVPQYGNDNSPGQSLIPKLNLADQVSPETFQELVDIPQDEKHSVVTVDEDETTNMMTHDEELKDVPILEQVDVDPKGTREGDVRRSERQREKVDRLQYARLGHPLVSVIQSLFQGLSTAFTSSLNMVDSEGIEPQEIHPAGAVTIQPTRCTGTCIPLGGEGVTQVT